MQVATQQLIQLQIRYSVSSKESAFGKGIIKFSTVIRKGMSR